MAGAPCRIQVQGLKELKAFLKDAPKEIKRTVALLNQDVAQQTIEWARPGMPRRSGAFASSWKAGRTQRGAVVTNKLPYAGVIEFGGAVGGERSSGPWTPRGGGYARVPMANGQFRMMGPHKIFVRPKSPGDSWHIYPTFEQHEREILDMYARGIEEIWQRT
jgi:hypothetical protein